MEENVRRDVYRSDDPNSTDNPDIGQDRVWWRVQIASVVLLIKSPGNADPSKVISRALWARGYRPIVQAQDPDGTWFTPAGPIPGDALVRRHWPAEWLEQCSARVATADDCDLFEQEPLL